MFLHEYPYGDLHEFNLDALFLEVKRLSDTTENWIAFSEVKFADPIEWSPTGYYRKNTIVMGSDGNTYITKQDCPVGIYVTDDRYWYKIGNYSAQVDLLAERLDEVDTRYNGITEATNNKVNKIESHGVVDSSRNILFITDSYGVFLSDAEGNFPYLTALYLGCNHTLKGAGGSGFAVGQKTFNTLLNETTGNYTDVVFCGGYNDRLVQPSTLVNAVIDTMNNCKTKYPNANMYVCAMGATMDTNANYTLANTSAQFMSACRVVNAKFIDLTWVLMVRNELAMDGVHPGGNGQIHLATCLANALKSYNVHDSQALYSTPITRLDNSPYNVVVCARMGNVAKMTIRYGECTFTNKITIQCDGNHPIELGEITNPIIQGGQFSWQHGYIHARGTLDSVANHFYCIAGSFHLEQSKLYFTPHQIKDNSNGYGGTAWITLNNVDYVAVDNITFIGVPYIN